MKEEKGQIVQWSNEKMAEKLNKIHNMDCLEFMKQVPDKYFDLTIRPN